MNASMIRSAVEVASAVQVIYNSIIRRMRRAALLGKETQHKHSIEGRISEEVLEHLKWLLEDDASASAWLWPQAITKAP